MHWTLDLDNPLAQRTGNTGGKGSNLARLTINGFQVPQGFVVTTAAYCKWINTADWWRKAVHDLPRENWATLLEAARGLQNRLSELPLPNDITAEIRDLVNRFPENTAFAIRSSSNMEDMADAAFAGQYDTFLNRIGADAVIKSVRQCYISLWHDRAIAYRHQKNCDQAAVQMAVVVQEMVPCDTAGVAFSINPVSGDLNVAVINANYGLGESVVNGECEVDHIEVDKTSGEILASHIAEKSMYTVASSSGGTADQETDSGNRYAEVLSGGNIAAIIELLKQTESLFHFPQDIEWGFVGDRLAVLQSRPITTIPPHWTRDESAERFPNAFTPLAWDFMDRGFHRSMDHSFNLMGFPPFSGKWFGKHDHYIYGNQNAVELYAAQLPFTYNSLDDLPTLIPHLREQYRWVQELPVAWSRDLDYYLIRLGEFMAEPVEEKSDAEVWDFVKRINEHGAQYFLPNIAISVTQGMLYKFLFLLLSTLFEQKKAVTLMDRLLAFCETKTGAVNRELYELAMIARQDPLLQQRLHSEAGNQALLESGVLQKEHSAFYSPFTMMMRNHGHRELEIDPYQSLWAEVPWLALDQIRLILDAPADLPPAERERDLKIHSQEAEYEIYRKVPTDLHFFVHEIIRLTRVYTSLDDIEHYQTTRLTVPLRKGLRALGQRMVQRGFLIDPMDIFFARESDIDSVIANDNPEEWQALANDIEKSKTSWEEARTQNPGQVLETEPPQVQFEIGTELNGNPGSPGTQEGKVFIVTGPQDFATFPSGAILVARTTNPVWTPLFYTAAAVITEYGGPLSHGAVTAREMGIPAVMSVKNCLSSLRNGCSVRVNGTEGKVVLLDSPSES